jgi:hypothetical protein
MAYTPGTVCRPKNGECDIEEVCSGTSAECPADAFAASTVVCRVANGVCDTAETCTGNSATCPAEAVVTMAEAKLCFTSTGPGAGLEQCRASSKCDGVGKACPVKFFGRVPTKQLLALDDEFVGANHQVGQTNGSVRQQAMVNESNLLALAVGSTAVGFHCRDEVLSQTVVERIVAVG